MKIMQPSVEVLDDLNYKDILKKIELAGRVCYKSEDKITEDSAKKFIRGIIKSGHESVIEHVNVSVRVICDRGVSHELVRHRLASYSQESTRYCNYGNGDICFIDPCDAFDWFRDGKEFDIWKKSMKMAENNYNLMIAAGCKPEEARSVLPNSVKTEVICTMNLREWRHFFKMRLDKRAHPQMRDVARMIFKELFYIMPVFFEDL